MSVKRVDPNGVYTDSDPGVSGVVVVGAQPVLADGSDATYLEVTPNGGGPSYQLSLLSSYTTGDPITLHVRLRILLDGPTDPSDDWRIEPFLSTDTIGADEFAGFSDGATAGFAFHIDPDAAAGIVEQAVPLYLAPWLPTTNDDVGAALIAGSYFVLNAFRWVDGVSEPLLRLYEAWITVGVNRIAPPCRITGREDGLGSGSGRIFPPPRSQQASNRVGGGSYY